jgi:hypothetical protein
MGGRELDPSDSGYKYVAGVSEHGNKPLDSIRGQIA